MDLQYRCNFLENSHTYAMVLRCLVAGEFFYNANSLFRR